MKEINVTCYDSGRASVEVSDLHINNENYASVIKINFTNTEQLGVNKWVDLVAKDGTSLRYDLGVDDEVEVDMSYPSTIPGELIITPFVYDGVKKVKYVPNRNIVIRNQEEAGDEAAILRDDYIFDLKQQVDNISAQDLRETATPTFEGVILKTVQLAEGVILQYNTELTVVEIEYPDGTTAQLSEESYARIINKNGLDILNGECVSVRDVQGQQMSGEHSDPLDDTDWFFYKHLGVATQDILVDALGKVTTFGLVHNIPVVNLESSGLAYVEGQFLFISLNGKLTNVIPDKPAVITGMGIMLKVSGTTCDVFVTTRMFPKIGNLSDVVTVFTGDEVLPALIYNKTTKIFEVYDIGNRWTDLVNPMTLSSVGKNLKPDYDDVNMGLLFPQNDPSEYVDVIVQFPHGYKEGSAIHPHIHIEQNQDVQAVFKMDYKWYNIGDPVPGSWTTFVMDENAKPYTSGNIHQLISDTGDVGIDGTGMKISSILKARIYRDDNVYVGDCLTLEFDIHYQMDALGSEFEYIK